MGRPGLLSRYVIGRQQRILSRELDKDLPARFIRACAGVVSLASAYECGEINLKYEDTRGRVHESRRLGCVMEASSVLAELEQDGIGELHPELVIIYGRNSVACFGLPDDEGFYDVFTGGTSIFSDQFDGYEIAHDHVYVRQAPLGQWQKRREVFNAARVMVSFMADINPLEDFTRHYDWGDYT